MRMLPRMTPLTSKTTIRGPSAAQASARLPGPEALRLVTLMILPPRPPAVTAPQPSAPGNALIFAGFASAAKVESIDRTATRHAQDTAADVVAFMTVPWALTMRQDEKLV